MKLKIGVVCTLFVALLFPVVSSSLSYSLSLDYSAGNFSLSSMSLVSASSPASAKDGLYDLQIVSYKSEKLFETSFSPSSIFFSIPINNETRNSALRSSKTKVNLLLPWFSNAKTVVILKNNSKIFSASLTQFSSCNENNRCDIGESLTLCPQDCTCGNNICEENHLTCARDCPSGGSDNSCDSVADNICDLDCEKNGDVDCRNALFRSSNMSVGVGLFVIIGIILFFAVRKKK